MCVGALKVYVFDKILMLVAAHTYNGTADDDAQVDLTDIFQHLTNTARMVEDNTFVEEDNVKVCIRVSVYTYMVLFRWGVVD